MGKVLSSECLVLSDLAVTFYAVVGAQNSTLQKAKPHGCL